MATIQELVERRRELVAQLAELDAEIRSRHGQPDPPVTPAKKVPAKKTASPSQSS